MTNPIGLDEVHKKLKNISRLQDVHGKRLEDASNRIVLLYRPLDEIEKGVDRANSKLDRMEDTQKTHGELLEEIMMLLRKSASAPRREGTRRQRV
jgi:hypothetical protein